MFNSRLTIKTETNSYPVYIDEDIRFHTYDLICAAVKNKASSFMIIADSHVADLYLNDVLRSFPKEITPHVALIPSGEASKSMEQFERLLTKALEAGLDRHSMVIALGGGVTGDLAGFVAASYMRGIRFVQMPTTLLAHDSSVGGKTGINHRLGKNLIGAFHPPTIVIYDSSVLKTLSEQEWRSGYAEVIKHGFIADPSFLSWLEKEITAFSDLSPITINELLRRSIAVKAKIVEEDEKEQGVRAYLNFGHTLAHAIEAELGYGKITHGEAVVIGMIFALKLSEEVYEHSLEYARIDDYLQRLGYSLKIPKECSISRLLTRMKMDKKTSNNQIYYVLLENIGKPNLVPVKDEQVFKLLEKEGAKG